MDREFSYAHQITSRVFAVIDVDNVKVVRVFRDEFLASDYADEYYYKTGNDCRVDRCVLVED